MVEWPQLDRVLLNENTHVARVSSLVVVVVVFFFFVVQVCIHFVVQYGQQQYGVQFTIAQLSIDQFGSFSPETAIV